MESYFANDGDLANLFDVADKDKSGTIKIEELKAVLTNKGLSNAVMEVPYNYHYCFFSCFESFCSNIHLIRGHNIVSP